MFLVRAPLRGRVFQHMDIFLFNDVPRFRHNESGFSQISIFCGCVKSHGRVWKNESLGVISLVFVGRKPSCWKRQLYAFSSLCFSRFCGKGLPDICTCRCGNFFARENPDTFHDVCLIQIASFSIVQCLWDTFFDVKPNTINLLSSCQSMINETST